MRAVGRPVHPAEFLNVRDPGGDAVAAEEIFIGGKVGRVDLFGTRDLGEFGVDDGEFVPPDVRRAVAHAVVGPGVVASWGSGGGATDDIGGDGAVAGVKVGTRQASGGNGLNDVTDLGDVFKNHGDAKGADDFHERSEVFFVLECVHLEKISSLHFSILGYHLQNFHSLRGSALVSCPFW